MSATNNKLNRRTFLQSMSAALTIPTAAALASANSKHSGKPNLLIIQTDEHNFRTLGCYRQTLPPEQAFMWGKDAIV